MLSGLTSFINKAKAGDATPPEDPSTTTTTTTDVELGKSRSGSTSGVESTTISGPAAGILNLRSSLPSWLGGKQEEEPAPPPAPPAQDNHSDAGSSDTGGADSDKERHQLDAELSSATPAPTAPNERVKNIGNFLFSIGSSIKGAGMKIKDTNPLDTFSRFNAEQTRFLSQAKNSMGGAGGVAPWVGHVKEEVLKEEVLGLSGDRRNFVRAPPTGVSFEWNYEEMLPVAKAILKEDPNLEKMRYELVPKIVSEENFWRNYFYRVMLLKGSLESNAPKKQDSIDTDEEEEVVDAELEKELNEELRGFEVVKKSEKDHDSILT